MAIPKFQDFLYPFLYQLKDKNMTRKEMKTALVQHFNLTEEDCTIKTKAGTSYIVDTRIGWTRAWLLRALFIDIPVRGTYHITQRGADYLKKHNDLRQEDLLKYPEFVEFANPTAKQDKSLQNNKEIKMDDIQELTPTELLENAFSHINDDLAADILQKTLESSSQFFEQLVVDLLVKMGYGGSNGVMAHVTPPSHDNGIDGILPEDTLGLDKIYIQAKRYTEIPVGKPDIQQFIGALNEQKASKGVFVTTSSFTKGAIESASKASSKIVLIDGKTLARYMIEYNVGVSTKKVYAVKKIDSDYFEE